MKKETFLNELFTPETDDSDEKYMIKNDTGFKYIEIPENFEIKENCTNKNYILFLLKGSFNISCNQYMRKVFSEKEIILIPRSSIVKISAAKGGQFLSMGFNSIEESNQKLKIQLLSESCNKIHYNFTPIEIKPALRLFIKLLTYCLEENLKYNISLHSIMQKEFFLLLDGFYTDDEIAQLLYPIIGKELDFKDFILKNYPTVSSIEDLVKQSNMGRSSFFSKFKEIFGMTAKQWMLKQTDNKILARAMEPGIRVKQLMESCGFESHAHFYRYFKQHFGCTPKQLITHYQRSI